MTRVHDVACRAVNVLVAAVGILLAAPLMLVIALVIKLTSPGPVLFTQPRVGINKRGAPDRRTSGRPGEAGRRREDIGGRVFTIYKFRTMTAPRATTGYVAPQVWASRDDPRITRVGKVLRKYRIDEIPQLFNVIMGDMNIVGPRPEQPEIFRGLRNEVDRYVERQRVLPGITGWAQVNHRYDQCLDDVRKKVELDLEYIHRRTPVEDLRIMAMTFPVMAGRKGAL